MTEIPLPVGSRQSDPSLEGGTGALSLFGSRSALRILHYFAIRQGARPHARLLQKSLELGGASLQRDLSRLVEHGVLERIPEGRLVRYQIVPRPNFWGAVQRLIAEMSDPASVVAAGLSDVPGLAAAFVFGSVASGKATAESDIDLFILETPLVDRRELNRRIAEIGLVLGREVAPVCYTELALAERMGQRSHPAHSFITQVLAGPKRWVAGNASALAILATAAGLSLGAGSPVSAAAAV